MLLDALDDLQASEPSGQERSQWSQGYDEYAPKAWQEICGVISARELPGCHRPAAWLMKINASITGQTLKLVAQTRCVQDMVQKHLMADISRHAAKRGLVAVDVCYVV